VAAKGRRGDRERELRSLGMKRGENTGGAFVKRRRRKRRRSGSRARRVTGSAGLWLDFQLVLRLRASSIFISI
jgi:hypothetical protein